MLRRLRPSPWLFADLHLVQIVCVQDNPAVVVYASSAPAGQSFLLGGDSSHWLNNPLRANRSAECVATLYSWDFTPVQVFIPYASVNFTAAGK